MFDFRNLTKGGFTTYSKKSFIKKDEAMVKK